MKLPRGLKSIVTDGKGLAGPFTPGGSFPVKETQLEIDIVVISITILDAAMMVETTVTLLLKPTTLTTTTTTTNHCGPA